MILTATEGEQNLLRESIGGLEHTRHAGRNRCYGRVRERDVVLLEGGIGATNTAHTLTSALEAGLPRGVLQIGIGGAYPTSGLSVGDVAVASEEIYGDLGITLPDRYALADEIGIPIIPGDPPRFNRMSVDHTLTQSVSEAAARIAREANCQSKTGLFVTLQQCTGCSALAAELETRFGGICETMEGAAAAHICSLYGVPFAEVRGISNIVQDRDLKKWDIPLASSRAQTVALAVLNTLA